MSVHTSADEALDKAREHVREAVGCLSDILIKEVWGRDRYSEEFDERLEEAFAKLREVKRALG